MSVHSISVLLLLTGLGWGVSKPADAAASMASLDVADSPPAAAQNADRSDAPAPGKLPPGPEAESVGKGMSPSFPGLPQGQQISVGKNEKEREQEEYNVVRGHLHVDLSLSTNLELVARLAPLMQRLMAEQELLSSSTSAGFSANAVAPSSRSAGGMEELSSGVSGVTRETTRELSKRAFPPSIQLELSYHIFDMEQGPTSAPHCVTGDLGRFCAFPPDEVPSSAEERLRQVGGRAVAEEELLQLCLAEAPRKNWFAAAGRVGERREAVPTERAASGTARERKTEVTTTAASSPARVNPSLTVGYSGPPGQHLKLLWNYLAKWSCHCSPRMHTCNPEKEAAAAGGQGAPNVISEESGAEQSSFPFQAACSRAQLERLSVPVPTFMERCEKAAADMLQHQVDNRLSVVPSLLLDGKPALGELTAESVLKTLCLVAEEQVAAALPPGASVPQLPAVCSAPEIMSSPSLTVKSFGLGANSDLIQDLDNGAPGELEVATHLLNTFARSPEGLATQPGAPTRPGIDTEGRYHFVNQKALRFLRKRLMRRSLKRNTDVLIVSAEDDTKDSPDVGGAATLISPPVGTSSKPHDGSAALDAVVIAASRSGSISPGGNLVATEVHVEFQQGDTQVAVPLAPDAPSPAFPSVVHPEDLSVEEGKRLRLDSPSTLKQHTQDEAVPETSTTSEGSHESTAPAQALPCEGRAEFTACLHPDGAAETVVNRGHLFNAYTTSWGFPVVLGFLLLAAALLWFFQRKRGVAFVSPPQPLEKQAAHQTALLEDELLNAATNRKL